MSCPGDCGGGEGRGTCNWMTGECACAFGWKGANCHDVDPFPCNNPNGEWTLTHCFGQCIRQRCYCGPGTKHPNRPLSDAPYMEAIEEYKRAVDTHDAAMIDRWDINVTSASGLILDWIPYHVKDGYGQGVTHKVDILEYCDAPEDTTWGTLAHMYPCWYPEQVGPMCSVTVPSICVNQCSGHGRCDRGFCVCQPEYFGIDCSIPVKRPSWTAAQSQLQGGAPQGQVQTVSTGARKLSRQELRLATLKSTAESSPSSSSSSLPSVQGVASQVATATVPPTIVPKGEGGLLLRGADGSSSNGGGSGGDDRGHDSSNKAKWPRIFVYELPALYNTQLLAFRRVGICTSREFLPEPGEKMQYSENLYNFDFMFLEWVLHSEHRTLDPDEADYFFVPFLAGCYNFFADDSPRHRTLGGFRMTATVMAAKLLLRHIRTAYPYWDKNGGADHIWMWLWDEGAAAAPAVIRNSIMVTSWGGRYVHPRTAYTPDAYIRTEQWHHNTTLYGMAFQDVPIAEQSSAQLFNPKGVTWAGDAEERGSMPGYDPDKDIVVPAPYFAWMDSPYSLYNRWRQGTQLYEGHGGPCTGCPRFNHDKLFYFAGEMGQEAHQRAGVPGGRPDKGYSWGIRQAVARHWWGEEARKKGMWVYPGHSDGYLKDMAHSIFCGALPGDGWSHGYVRAILHGCIPVIIMDDVEEAFSNVFNYSQFSIRVAEKDIPRLYEILTSVPQKQIDRMQSRIRRIWPRFVYRRYRTEIFERMQKLGYNVDAMRGQLAADQCFEGEDLGSDAMDTMLELLYVRLKKQEQALGNTG
eukprot:jgi/Mesvir1/8698/Mv02634-RA.1